MTDVPSPGVSEFYFDGEPQLSPERAIAERCERQGITPDQMGVRPAVVATFFPQLTAYLGQQSGASRSEHWWPGTEGRELFVVDEDISITTLPIGAAAACMIVEELIACGARTILVVGAAGSLQRDLPIGSAVAPTRTVREEGTSYHYLPPEAPAEASADALAALRAAWLHSGEVREGLHWTTDAPYREHKERIAAYREAGVLSVDMEVSALYAVAQHRGVSCAAILAISDELYEPWRIGFFADEFPRAMARCGLAALEAARV
jgi:nucleoside phosphorylase